MQTLILDTICGPKPILAPDDWKFDKSATIVWSTLLRYTCEQRHTPKSKRDGFVLAGKIDALANVLANSLGMATYYWITQARAIAHD